MIKLYFDSAAFTAWKSGKPIDVKAYADFIEAHPEAAGYVNLDVIPGQPGRPRSGKDVEHAAEEGWSNYLYLRKRGLEPMPVYHMGERRYWLEKMIGEGATFVGLGGVATAADAVRRPWLDEVFSYLCGSKGFPAVKVHGFGITGAPLIHRFPWFSTDSVSWMLYSAYGFSIVPRFGPGGEPDYTQSPYSVGFSRGSSTGKVHKAHLAGQHYDVMGKGTQDYIRNYIESHGYKIEQLHTDRVARTKLTLKFYRGTVDAHEMKPFIKSKPGLFNSVSFNGLRDPRWKYRMWFTMSTSADQSALLQEAGFYHRLLSFVYFRGKNPFNIARYIETGVIESKRGTKRRRAVLVEG